MSKDSYYMDDTGQRAFIFWILTLSIFFGNQVAYFASDYEGVKVALVSTYIIVRASFVFMEIFYSFWIPWIRKLIFVHFLVMLPASGLWMGTIFTDGPAALGPALAAIGWEYFVPWILESPIGAKLHSHDYRKDVDPTHLKARMGSFLIITVGEGVLMLVRGGPTGQGFTAVTALAAWSLLLYFLLAYLYFYRDGSIRYIPAVRRGGWRRLIWITSVSCSHKSDALTASQNAYPDLRSIHHTLFRCAMVYP
jgi:low temperature requirement protein LtrA